MGTSGTSITSDDTVADVVADVVDELKRGATLRDASSRALERFKEQLQDSDDGPLVWLALAHVQWKYGEVDPIVMEQVRRGVATGRGLDRWREGNDPALLRKRQKVLETFLAKISTPNPKPSKPPKLIERPAPFETGDCLAIATSTGEYTAAIVLQTNNSMPEYGL